MSDGRPGSTSFDDGRKRLSQHIERTKLSCLSVHWIESPLTTDSQSTWFWRTEPRVLIICQLQTADALWPWASLWFVVKLMGSFEIAFPFTARLSGLKDIRMSWTRHAELPCGFERWVCQWIGYHHDWRKCLNSFPQFESPRSVLFCLFFFWKFTVRHSKTMDFYMQQKQFPKFLGSAPSQ